MATEKPSTEKSTAADKPAETVSAQAVPPPIVGAPPLQLPDDDPKAGPGQVVVTSPTGYKSVVEEHAVESLKHQGYTVG